MMMISLQTASTLLADMIPITMNIMNQDEQLSTTFAELQVSLAMMKMDFKKKKILLRNNLLRFTFVILFLLRHMLFVFHILLFL
jgi:hypothetical protein